MAKSKNKSIGVSPSTYAELNNLREKGESFDAYFQRLLVALQRFDYET